MPTIPQLLLAELDREMVGTRRTLERVPEGQNDWKPHEKSMPLGDLARLVAIMPRWIVSMLTEDQLDLATPGEYAPQPLGSTDELVRAFDQAVAEGRAALTATTDETAPEDPVAPAAQGPGALQRNPVRGCAL